MQRFARNKIDLKNSTLIGWVSQSLAKLEILYEHVKNQIIAKGYLQVDETTLKVQDSNLKGIGSPNRTHLGYFWVYNSPMDDILFFEYHKGRAAKHVNKTLKDFSGYLQTDGYAGYNGLAQKEGIIHVGCMAHARRKFDEAKANDILRAEKALFFFQVLYQIEAEARQQSLDAAARKELRLTESLPVLNELGKWMVEENKKVLPKSKIGMAFHYSIERWDALTAYLNDGNLEIDRAAIRNNLIENAIRPIALGRKIYLFAGSHEAAQRSAMIYTFFGICKKHNINPTDWLNYVFKNIQSTKISELDKLLPQNFGKL